MKTSIGFTLLWAVGLVFTPTQTSAQQTVPPGPAAFFKSVNADIVNLAPDQTKGATVKDLIIQRDAGTFRLEKGELYLCTPVGGHVRAAVFTGAGTFLFVPPNPIEKGQLRRFYKKDSLAEPFTACVFVFADSTGLQLQHGLQFTARTPPNEARLAVSKAAARMSPESRGARQELLQPLLENETTDMFYADISTTTEGPMFYLTDPTQPLERILLMRLLQDRVTNVDMETVCQFGSMGNDIDAPEDIIKIQSYTIDCTIPKDLNLKVDARIDILSLAENKHWIPLELYPTLKIDSAAWSDGNPCTVFRLSDGYVWVYRKTPIEPNKTATLLLRYSGPFIDRQENVFALRQSLGWYPDYGYLSKAGFDMTFRVYSKYDFVGVGDKVSEKTEDDYTVSHWVTPEPIRNCSFNIGFFNTHVFKKDSLPEVVITQSRYEPRDDQQVGEDILESIRLFQTIYGKLPVKKFYVSDIPGFHGEAFPGMIHLSQLTFTADELTGSQQVFRAHEVAHQWWGIGVDFQSYRDRWLSEAFAEYSGLLYMQAVLKDNDKFFKILGQYKETLLSIRKSFLVGSQEASPICLGHRVETSTTGGDYFKIVYKKGAWVLHMLRNMLLDQHTMKEDVFMGVMHEFFTTYAGRRASTADFQEVVEKAIGTDMSWFFRQWINQTAIPHYAFSYKTQKTQDGKYRTLCNVKQTNVPDDFLAYILIKLDLGKKYQPVRFRIKVTGSNTTVELPQLPVEPKEVIFNDLGSVLCDSETTSWKD